VKTDIKGYSIYKPNKTGKGAAAQFNPDSDLRCIWMEMASQAGDRDFNWDNKIVFKLGHSDLLQMIYTLQLVRTSKYIDFLRCAPSDYDEWILKEMADNKGNLLNIFHADRNTGNTSSLTIRGNSASYGGGFRVKLYKKFSDGKVLTHQIGITPPEALGILYVLEKPLKALSSPAPSSRTTYSNSYKDDSYNE
jgi:hypothetical protein